MLTPEPEPEPPLIEHVVGAGPCDAAADARNRATVARQLADAKLSALGFAPGTFAATQVLAAATADEAHRVAAEAAEKAEVAREKAAAKLNALGLGFRRKSPQTLPEPDPEKRAASDCCGTTAAEDLRTKMGRVFTEKGLETMDAATPVSACDGQARG